jgi:hypothetical protein
VHDVRRDVALAVVDAHWPPRKLTDGLGALGGLLKNSKHPALNTEETRAIASNFLVMTAGLLPQLRPLVRPPRAFPYNQAWPF